MVLPGTYNERDLLKNGVNWHFLAGATVNFTKEETGAIFDMSTQPGAVICAITGSGVFNVSNSQSTGHVVNFAGSSGSTTVLIEARSMYSQTGMGVKTVNSAGALFVDVKESIIAASSDAIAIQGAGMLNTIKAHFVNSSGGSVLSVSDGAVVLTAYKMSTSGGAAVSITGGSSSEPTVIRAFEILSGDNFGVHYNTTSGALLHIHGARIKSSGDADYGDAVKISSSAGSSSNKVRLHNCVLIASSAATYSIASVNALSVQTLNGCAINKTTYNVTAVGGAFSTPDSNIT